MLGECKWLVLTSYCLALTPVFQDVYSYDMEQSRGIGGNNVVTVLMKDNNIDLQAASDLVGVQFKVLMDRHLDARKRLPSWGPETDAGVARYMDAMAHWVRGNLEYVHST